MIHFKRLSLMASLLFLCLTPVVQGENNVIWQSQNDYLDIRWTETDIIATKNGKQLFSARALAKKEFEADFLTELSGQTDCQYDREFTLLSLIGNIASLKETESVKCQGLAEPSTETRLTAYDLALADSKMELTRFFTESDILKALLAEPLIEKALAEADTTHPSTLQALDEALEWSDIPFKGCEYQLPQDFLNQFAVHHIQKNQVAIRLNLPAASFSGCDSRNIQLGFYLPIPRSEKRLFNQVRRGYKGFLKTRNRKSVYGKSTQISFSTASYSRKKPKKLKFQPTFSFSKATASRQPANTITVQRGDTLYGIAKKSGHSIDEIAAWNHLQRPYDLSIGQTLIISKPTDIADKTTVKPDYHTVDAGETLYRIAKQYGHSFDELAAWNQLQAPYNLLVGQKLQVSKPLAPQTIPETTTVPETVLKETEPTETVVVQTETEPQNSETVVVQLEPQYSETTPAVQVETEPQDIETVVIQVETEPQDTETPAVQLETEPQNTEIVVVQLEPQDTETPAVQVETEPQDTETPAVQVETEPQDTETPQAVQVETEPQDTETPAEQPETPIKQRIITASGVHLRSAPKRSATLVGKLKLGTIVKELARSDTQEQIGQSKDYWYQVALSSGKQGWIFGSLSTDFDPKLRAKHYQQIAQARLNKALSWPDTIDLTTFLARVKHSIHSPPEMAAELALSHLRSLQKAINQVENSEVPPYQAWFEKQLQQYLIYLDEVQGVWLVDSRLFWTLHDQYYPLPISDQIAWAGAENPLGGECEGFLECNLSQLNETTGKYLKYHPQGQHVEEALNKIAGFISLFKTTEQFVVSKEDVDLFRLFAVLRATVERSNHPSKNAVLIQIDQFLALVLTKDLNSENG
jgi:LysM repeat protein